MPNLIHLRLKEARKKAKITQKNLGIKIGINENVASARMNQYEKNRNNPTFDTLDKIAKELGLPILYFLCEDDLMAELVCRIDKLSDEEKEQLLLSLR